MDKLTPERRSWLMGQVRGKNTGPEMIVRRLAFSMGYRYRLHVPNLPGKPDMVFAGRMKAIFINGCFWHGHLECRFGRLPKTRVEYWEAKILKNVERDKRNTKLLEEEGWAVLTIWQCQLANIPELSKKLRCFLED